MGYPAVSFESIRLTLKEDLDIDFNDLGIETVPGRGFYVMFRLYSPTEGLFDGTWALPDVELT